MALLRWKVKDIVDVIIGCVNNEFDCIIFVEGNRGSGKSTLCYQLAKKCANRGLTFNAKNHMVYSRKDTLKLLATKKRTVIFSDELINVSYNRDFYEKQQKQLLKALNLYRDHTNVFLGAIPNFNDLDNQIRRLCKIRISIKRRGLALIHIPIQSSFLQDKWDTQNNLKKELKNPRAFSKLSTVKGILKFPDLNPKAKAKYKALKELKRAQVVENDFDLQEMNPQNEMYDKIYKKIISNEISDKYLHDTAELLNKKYTGLCSKLNQMLKDNNLPTLGVWLKKARDKENSNIPKVINPRKFI